VHPLSHLSGGLAAAFLAGEWSEEALVRRGREAVAPPPPPRWMRQVAAEVLAYYHHPPLDRPRELTRFVDIALARIPPWAGTQAPRIRRWFVSELEMGRRWDAQA
jgi:RNA-directed DNA polymerase